MHDDYGGALCSLVCAHARWLVCHRSAQVCQHVADCTLHPVCPTACMRSTSDVYVGLCAAAVVQI